MILDFLFRSDITFSIPRRRSAQLIHLAVAARYYDVTITGIHVNRDFLLVSAVGHRADLVDFMTVAQRDGHLRSLAITCIADFLQ